MALNKTGKVTWSTAEGWDVRSAGPVRGRRRAAVEAPDPFVANLTATSRWEVQQTLVATPKARRGEATPAPLTLDVEGGSDDGPDDVAEGSGVEDVEGDGEGSEVDTGADSVTVSVGTGGVVDSPAAQLDDGSSATVKVVAKTSNRRRPTRASHITTPRQNDERDQPERPRSQRSCGGSPQ